MNFEKLNEEELDLEILIRVGDIKALLESGEAILVFKESDSADTIGKLIKRALFHADGAIIQIRQNENNKI